MIITATKVVLESVYAHTSGNHQRRVHLARATVYIVYEVFSGFGRSGGSYQKAPQHVG